MSRPGWAHLDQEDVRHRPSRYGSRPRTKQRPAHAGAVPGMVIAVDRGRYIALVETPGERHEVEAMTAREMGRERVVVGDTAYLVGDLSGAPGTLARIVRRGLRTTELRRSTEEGRGRERVIVANADQMVVVTALADPPPRPRMIDRALVAGYDAGMDALICLTKADLGSQLPLRALYEPLGVAVVATGREVRDGSGGETPRTPDQGAAQDQPRLWGLDEVRAALKDRVSVLVGHSGVGKSTLVNALVPSANRATGAVNAVTGRGRHTSSSAVALELPEGGWVIDTPGVRSFGLAHVSKQSVLAAFPDLAEAAEAGCPRGCPHTAGALDCALDDWEGDIPSRRARVDSFRRLLASREGPDERT